jgi:Flp pilus assembly protein TadD
LSPQLRREEYAAARKHLARAIRRGWTGADAYINRGVALAKLGRVEKARVDFERALQLDPANREASANLRVLP